MYLHQDYIHRWYLYSYMKAEFNDVMSMHLKRLVRQKPNLRYVMSMYLRRFVKQNFRCVMSMNVFKEIDLLWEWDDPLE